MQVWNINMEIDISGVGGIVCWYSRKKCKENKRIYSKSITRRFGIWPNENQRVCWSIYGRASKGKKLIISPGGNK